MVSENITLNTSGLGVSEQESTRAVSAVVLVAYDSANDVYVPVACDAKGNLFTSGAS